MSARRTEHGRQLKVKRKKNTHLHGFQGDILPSPIRHKRWWAVVSRSPKGNREDGKSSW